MNYEPFLKPAGTIKGAPAYKAEHIDDFVIKEFTSGSKSNVLTRTENAMSNEIKAVTESVEESKTRLLNSLKSLRSAQEEVSAQSKKVSGDVRLAAESLSQGLSKIEKQANFDKLERYVALLERAASAMSQLADLERAGKLDKIVGALK